MESKLGDKNFRRRLRVRLDNLATLYSNSARLFLEEFIITPEDYLKVIVECSLSTNKYRNTRVSDLVDYCAEIFYYYQSCYKQYFKIKEKENKVPEKEINKDKPFSLHNSKDLERFESFLDKMLLLLDLNADKFVQLLPKCPVELWDKIDDLRETSFKSERDSPEYTRCLQKCKKISLTYHKLSNPKHVWEPSESLN